MVVEGGPGTCNTGPSNSRVDVLAAGWDSIYLSFKGDLRADVGELLAALKTAAAENGDGETINVAGLRGVVQPHGRGAYPYLIRCDGLDLQVTTSAKMPTVYCQLRTGLLHSAGVHEASQLAGAAAAELVSSSTASLVSRADVYADFIGWLPTEADLPRFITRSRRRGEFFDEAEGHFDGRVFTGFRFGSGDLVARLYDKSREIKSSGKMWFWDLWGERSARQSVWRLEFQFRRPALRDFSVAGASELAAAAGDLWRYATQWLSLRNPTANKQAYRWPIAAEWAALAAAQAEQPVLGLVRGRVKQQKEEFLLSGLGGLLTSWAALHGIGDQSAAMRLAGRASGAVREARDLVRCDRPTESGAPPRAMRVRSEELAYQAAIRGWDQAGLARAAGVSEATISRALAGRGIRRSTLLRVAGALRSARPLAELEAVVER